MTNLEETPLLQRIAVACWREEGVRSPTHLGGLAWALNQHLDKLDEVTVWIWDEVAYSLEYGTSDGAPVIASSRRAELVEEVLDRLRGAVVVPDHDQITAAALARRGFRPEETPESRLHARPLDGIAAPHLPDGYRVRGFEPGDLDARVEAHRSAFAPSRVVPESYLQVQRLPSYDPELDVVVEAPDGRIAAYCLAWLDEENRAGELEPVGTHAEFRRLGLASAACTEALRRLHARGAEVCIVGSRPDGPAEALYRSIGFAPVMDWLVWKTGMSDT